MFGGVLLDCLQVLVQRFGKTPGKDYPYVLP